MAELAGRVAELVEARVGRPVISYQPAAGGLVGFPLLVSTVEPGVLLMPVSEPLPGLVRATPSLEWEFDHGDRAHGAGRQYDGTSPVADPGHYVSSVFSSPGVHQVALTVRWRATWTVGGITVPLPDVVTRSDVAVPVREARAELVQDSPAR
ncbi:MAG: hypothetical protein ACYCXA_10605 [Actinomycetes bacterium]